MTIKEIARSAGVSPATVSRALNDDPRVSPDTKKRICAVAQDLDYRPNICAKGLASQKTFTIGYMIPDITDRFYGEVMRGIEEITDTNDYSIILFNTDYQADKERRAINFLREGRIDGLIAYVSNRVIDECISLVNHNLPLVTLGHFIDEIKTTKIGCNNISSAYTATEYLIKAGHRRIAHVAGHMETKTAKQRMQGYRSALETYDIPVNPDWIVPTNYEEETAYENSYRFLKREKGNITAIFAANDMLAVGCYRAIYELGLSVPEDISVVGHDDTGMASILRPGLTTMHQHTEKIGRLAAQHLFAKIANGNDKPKDIILPTTLVERNSVRIIEGRN